jgi:hypothetical protein
MIRDDRTRVTVCLPIRSASKFNPERQETWPPKVSVNGERRQPVVMMMRYGMMLHNDADIPFFLVFLILLIRRVRKGTVTTAEEKLSGVLELLHMKGVVMGFHESRRQTSTGVKREPLKRKGGTGRLWIRGRVKIIADLVSCSSWSLPHYRVVWLYTWPHDELADEHLIRRVSNDEHPESPKDLD